MLLFSPPNTITSYGDRYPEGRTEEWSSRSLVDPDLSSGSNRLESYGSKQSSGSVISLASGWQQRCRAMAEKRSMAEAVSMLAPPQGEAASTPVRTDGPLLKNSFLKKRRIEPFYTGGPVAVSR